MPFLELDLYLQYKKLPISKRNIKAIVPLPLFNPFDESTFYWNILDIQRKIMPVLVRHLLNYRY